ncbi:MAG: hypothetical protein LBJ10_04620 [Clostridiales bacterium]|nr:hypothetical protein [Clostridiales bacterium]
MPGAARAAGVASVSDVSGAQREGQLSALPMAAAAGVAVTAIAAEADAESEAAAAVNALLLAAINGAEAGTEPFLVTVTKPLLSETVYKDAFSICGARSDGAEAEDVLILYLAKFNPATQAYEEFLDVDGETRALIGPNGVFTSNVLLTEGENSFAIAVCKEALGDRLTPADIQVTMFTIVCKGRSVADKISEKLKGMTILSIFKELEGTGAPK